jgi:hypothetical protein
MVAEARQKFPVGAADGRAIEKCRSLLLLLGLPCGGEVCVYLSVKMFFVVRRAGC